MLCTRKYVLNLLTLSHLLGPRQSHTSSLRSSVPLNSLSSCHTHLAYAVVVSIAKLENIRKIEQMANYGFMIAGYFIGTREGELQSEQDLTQTKIKMSTDPEI
jgi:hypothetical protein